MKYTSSIRPVSYSGYYYYTDILDGKYDPELMSALTDGLPRETLEHLKAGLATGDPDVYDYFGLGNDEETGNADFTRTRKR